MVVARRVLAMARALAGPPVVVLDGEAVLLRDSDAGGYGARRDARGERAKSGRAITALMCVGALIAGCGGQAPSSPPRFDAEHAVAPRRALTGAPAARSYAPWPSFGHDPSHTGASQVVGPQSARIRWRRRLEGPVVPGPVVGRGGVVYAASNGGVLHALDLRTGRDRWTFDGGGSYGSDLSTVPAILPDGTILWPGPRSTLFALDRAGRLLWRETLPGQPLSPALTPGGDVIVADASGTVQQMALGARGQQPRRVWRVDAGDTSYAGPAVRGDTVYTTVDDALVAIRAGRIQWRVRAGAISEVSPAVTPDGTIVFGANDGIQYGVAPGGEVRWRHRSGALTYSSSAATRDGLVYFGDHHGFVNVLDGRSGRLVARPLALGRSAARRSVGIWTAPVVDARHDVYFGTRPGHIYGFAASGRRLLDIDTGATVDSNPALASDGTLLIGSENGLLYAIR